MPGIIVIRSPEPSQRRLVIQQISRFESDGIELIRVQEGGDWQELFSAAQTGGLFSKRGYIRIESAEMLGKFPEQLTDLVEAADAASTFLLMIYSGDHRKYFAADTLKIIRTISPPQIPRWRNKRCDWLKSEAAARNIRIQTNALMLLLDSIDDPDEMLSEMEKLSFVADGEEIPVDLVRELTLDEGKNALLDLMDGICLAKQQSVITALEFLKKKSDPIPVLSALYNRIRIAAMILSFRQFGKKQIQKELNFRDYQLRMAGDLTQRYRHDDIMNFAVEIITMDYREKTNYSRGWIALESSILKFLGTASHK